MSACANDIRSMKDAVRTLFQQLNDSRVTVCVPLLLDHRALLANGDEVLMCRLGREHEGSWTGFLRSLRVDPGRQRVFRSVCRKAYGLDARFETLRLTAFEAYKFEPPMACTIMPKEDTRILVLSITPEALVLEEDADV